MNFAFNDILFAFLLAIFAGASTCAGAAIAFFSKQDNTKMLSAGLGFSAGVMVYLSFVELLPASIEEFSKLSQNGEIIALFIFFVSMLACLFIDKAVPVDINPHEIKAPEAYCGLRSCYFNDRELCIAKQLLPKIMRQLVIKHCAAPAFSQLLRLRCTISLRALRPLLVA